MAKKSDKPNILVIWGDDIGISNLSCYTNGLMGYQTPNIDRIAKEGMMFTDSYGEQSCTAGRSSFITGQSVLRTGLSKVWASTRLPSSPSHQKRSCGITLVSDQFTLMVKKLVTPARFRSCGNAGENPKQSGSQQTLCRLPNIRSK